MTLRMKKYTAGRFVAVSSFTGISFCILVYEEMFRARCVFFSSAVHQVATGKKKQKLHHTVITISCKTFMNSTQRYHHPTIFRKTLRSAKERAFRCHQWRINHPPTSGWDRMQLLDISLREGARAAADGSGSVPPRSPVPSAWDAKSRLRSALLLVKWRKLIELYSSHEGNCFWVNGCFQQRGRQAERHKQALSWRDKLTQSPRLQIATIKYVRRRHTNNIPAHCGPAAAPLSGWVIIFNERPQAKRNRSKPPYHE